jgi:hypothetical protein
VFQKKIHVFKAGDQTSAQGVQRTFSPKDLQQVVDTYDPTVHEAPLVIGHQGDNDSVPSYGWIKGFSRQGDNLYADVEFTDTAKDLVKDGHYRKVSISFYSPDSQINPSPGKWSARHLALLGAAPPAVKGLEPFSFSEKDGVFDYAAVTLSPEDIFDEELGPTLIVEKSPIEMLKEKLEAVRNDMNAAVADLQESNGDQQETEVEEADGSAATELSQDQDENQPDEAGDENPSSQYSEHEIAQQTADLEDNLPEEPFMEDGKISRKQAKGANGQVMQVVENVYKEKVKAKMAELSSDMDEQHGEMPEAFKKNAEKMKAKAKGGAEESENPFAKEHGEMPEAFKKNMGKGKKSDSEGEGKPSGSEIGKSFAKGKNPFTDHAEDDEFGRYETARNDDDSYGKRMEPGKQGADGEVERMKTAKNGEQQADRLNTAKNGSQEADRKKTAKSDDADKRFEGEESAKEQIENMDQYDADESSYGVNKPKTASGANPAGREDSDTKVPTETEETPDDTVFAVGMTNVMSDKNMRVLRQTSSQGRAAVKGGAIDHAEPEADEETSELGVTAHAEEKGKKKQLSGEFEGGDNETVGPSGAYSERGEKKSSEKQLSGQFDKVDEADQTVGPDGAYAEEGKKKQLSGDFEGGPNETVKQSGGAFSEKKKPYTKTGFGSTYEEEGEEEGGEDVGYSESEDFCGMEYGMGSMGQSRSMNAGPDMSAMFEELKALKEENGRIKREYQESKMNARKEKIAQFVDSLYSEGKIVDGVMPQRELQSYCEGLEFGTLEFSEGETPATKLLGLLNNLPPMVTYGEMVPGGSFQYSEEDLDPHAKALRLVETEGLDYVEALKRSMFS